MRADVPEASGPGKGWAVGCGRGYPPSRRQAALLGERGNLQGRRCTGGRNPSRRSPWWACERGREGSGGGRRGGRRGTRARARGRVSQGKYYKNAHGGSGGHLGWSGRLRSAGCGGGMCLRTGCSSCGMGRSKAGDGPLALSRRPFQAGKMRARRAGNRRRERASWRGRASAGRAALVAGLCLRAEEHRPPAPASSRQ